MHYIGEFHTYERLYSLLTARLLDKGTEVDVGEWQSTDISGKPEMVSFELDQVSFDYRITAGDTIPANLPWAEEHFQERVSGIPHNPPPSHKNWPYAQTNNDQWKGKGQFSHTYPERIWPKEAGYFTIDTGEGVNAYGIRFDYGDLTDVISLLINNPLTRQAYLPIWFPEDTGVVHGKRVPCTLGYHFMIRNNQLTCTYYIRSCDLRRHFADDLYMAVRLAQWVAGKISGVLQVRQGFPLIAHRVIMHIASLHIFQGDYQMMTSYGPKPEVQVSSNIMKGLG